MDRTLITPDEVREIAFSATDHMDSAVIKDSKIVAAQNNYLRPAFNNLYDAMLEGKYVDLVDKYIKPALAYYVRYGVIPDMSIQMGNNGMTVAYTSHTNAATDKQRDMLRRQALEDAGGFMREAVEFVENNLDKFPEYIKRDNVRHKVGRVGGLLITGRPPRRKPIC